MLRLFFPVYPVSLLLGACSPLSEPPTTSPAPAPAPAVVPAVETPDYAGAIWEPAHPGNFQPSDRPSAERPIDRIVIHDIEGSGVSAVRWFQNPQAKVSSHYVIDAEGRVYQMLKERDIGWHAGDRITNARSVGIEHDGFAYRPGFFNLAEYESSARLTRDIARRHNIPRDREHIIGHFEVPDSANPGKFGGRSGHTDPGPYWDWDTFFTLVRNDARIENGTNTIAVEMRPGEAHDVTVSLSNQGDDVWPADLQGSPAPDLRAQGPVYLGTYLPGVGLGANSAFYGRGWVSPRVASPTVGGDTAPGATGSFVLPLHAPTEFLGRRSETFRLFKIPTAPRQPVPFGPAVAVSVNVVPWEVAVSPPIQPPPGWSVKETPDGHRTVWRKAVPAKPTSKTPAAVPVRYEAVLPVAGYWDVYVRYPAASNRPIRATYRVTGVGAPETFTVNQKQGGGQWRKLGRVAFAAPAVAAPGVRPGQPTPAPPNIVGRVELAPDASRGVLATGDVRFVGPFPARNGPTDRQ